MPTFKSFDALQKHILKKGKVAVREVQETAYNTIDAFLHSHYDEFTPVEYVRTQQILHSLVKSEIIMSGNSCKAEVYFDAGLLSYPNPAQGQSGSWHIANWSSEKVLDDFVGEGGHGGYSHDIVVWDESMKRFDREMYGNLQRALIAAGIPIR